MNQALSVFLTTKMQSTLSGSVLQVFVHAGPPQRVDCLAPMEISVSVFPQEHNDAMLVRESNQGSAIFRSLARRSTTKLSPPLSNQ